MAWLTTKQAGERLGVSDARIRSLIKDGRLPAQKFGHIHMISEDDLKLVENRKVGRPPKAPDEKVAEKRPRKKSAKRR